MGMVATALAAIRRIVGLLSACRISACGNRLTAAPTPSEVSYGRLYRSRRLHHVRGGACALILAALVSPGVLRATSCPAADNALAACQAAANSQGGTCTYNPNYGGRPAWVETVHGSIMGGYAFTPCGGWTPPPDNPCTGSGVPNFTGLFQAKILKGYSWCKGNVPTGYGSATTSCTMSFQPSGQPVMNEWGHWVTPGTLSATGNTCDGTGGSGSNSWKNPDGTPAAAPVPPAPDTTPPQSPMPKTCGGGSCYDSANDQYCATSGGGQICVSGNSARSGSGGCASSGDSTVCAGSPTSPMPPSSKNPDAASSLRNSDTYTQADPVTGANQTVNVNTYTNPGGTATTSGQGTGDSGPPSAQDGTDCKPGDLCNDRYVGASCDGDPSVAGDPLLGAIATDMHHVRCDGDKNNIKASDFDSADHSQGDDHSPDEVFVDGSTTDTGLSGLDSTGFLGGHGVCPGFQPIEYLGMNIMNSDGICQSGSMLSSFILAMAYAYAALVMARVKSGG